MKEKIAKQSAKWRTAKRKYEKATSQRQAATINAK